MCNRFIWPAMLLLVPLGCEKKAPLPPTVAEPAEGAFKGVTLDAACSSAESEGKLVFVDVFTTWCGPCKMLDKTTWKDADVVKWLNEKAVAIKLDAEKNREFAAKYKVAGYPTMILIKPDGTEIDRIVGYRPAAQFLSEIKDAASGKDSISRARDALKSGNPNDPMQRMKLADALAEKGREKEALEEYLWCFDHGLEHSSSFRGVRLSFLLSDIQNLGKDFPPAIAALKERRDAAEKALLAEQSDGNGASENAKAGGLGALFGFESDARHGVATDFAALNETLNQQQRTVDAFDTLRKRDRLSDEVRAILVRNIFDDLLERKRYQDIIGDSDDPAAPLDHLFEMYEQFSGPGVASAMVGEHKDEMVKYARHEIITEGGKYYEALLGVGKTKDARALAKRIAKVDRSGATVASLIEHAKRAENNEEAARLARSAMKHLPETERQAVRDAAGGLALAGSP